MSRLQAILFTGPTPNETLPVQTFGKHKYEALLLSVVVVIAEICTYPHCPTDEYQCTGNAETDFPALCALLNVKDIPAVIAKFPASSASQTEGVTSKQEMVLL